MSSAKINDSDHVARYCKPSTLSENGSPTGLSFLPRPSDDHLSVNWLEYFKTSSLAEGVQRIQRALALKNFDTKPSGKFAVITVVDVKDAGRRMNQNLRIARLPTDHDESHAGIFGYTHTDLEIAEEIAHVMGSNSLYGIYHTGG